MKHIKFLLTLALLMTAVIGARAEELTVSDGTVMNSYVPVYGFYADAYLKAEMVYPAEDLTAMTGKSISSMKFYAQETSVAWGSIFKVFMKEIEGTTLSNFVGMDDATLVYEGTLELAGDGVMTVSFSTAYTYNGGNLLVGFYNTTTGTYLSSNWYGTVVTGASVSGYSYTSLETVTATERNFLPKVTFEYTAGYSLTVGTSANGSVKFMVDGEEVTSAEEGDKVTVVVTPDDGYNVDDVTGQWYTGWDKANSRLRASNIDVVKDVVMTKVNKTTYTFTMKPYDVVVNATYLFNSCGDGLIWTLEGTDLTISYEGEGTGVMTDYEWVCGPWGAGITSVSLGDGVASIGNCAFEGCNELSTVIIHGNVKSIGWYAFAECLSLITVTIPASVTSIGSEAFRQCRNVADVYCYADPNNLTWYDGSCDDFKEGKATLCHVPGEYLATYQAKWSTGDTRTDINVTFVTDDKTVVSTTQVTDVRFAGYWTTYYTSISNMQAPEGVTVYKGAVKEGHLALTEISDRIINACEGVILKKATEGSIELTTSVSASADSYMDNELEGVDLATSTSYYADKALYTLAKPEEKLGFYSFTGTTLAANKAFLALDASVGARSFSISIGAEETTGIEKVERGATKDAIFYDLQGRRVTQPTKGLYIKDGKKIMVK